MKRSDFLAILFIGATISIFIIPQSRVEYGEIYKEIPIILSFLKFALLATFGEMLVKRIATGSYLDAGFGLLSKALVWGVLGVSLYFAFTIFYGGVSWLLFKGEMVEGNFMKLSQAFLISFFMNIFYAPILMITHHITDIFITENRGGFPIRKFKTLQLVKKIDWDKMWGFVIKRTIPLFWIPIHTITFLLPEQYRILIAAFLSIVLGIFLSFKSVRPS